MASDLGYMGYFRPYSKGSTCIVTCNFSRRQKGRQKERRIERNWDEQLHHKAGRSFVGGSGQPLGDTPWRGLIPCRRAGERARDGCRRRLAGKAPAGRKNAARLAVNFAHRG